MKNTVGLRIRVRPEQEEALRRYSAITGESLGKILETKTINEVTARLEKAEAGK